MTDETQGIQSCPICGNNNFVWDKPLQGEDVSAQDHISGLLGVGADRRDVVLRICNECGNIQAFDESILPDEDDEDAELSDSLHGWLEYELDLSHGEIMRLVDKRTMLAQGWLASRSSQSTQFKGTSIKAVASGQDSPDLNVALGAEFSPFVEDDVIDAEIDKVIAFFKDKNVSWSWWLSPFVQPEDFEERLKKRGLTTKTHKQTAMILPLPADLPKLKPNIQVWLAEDSKNNPDENHDSDQTQANWLKDEHVKVFLAQVKKDEGKPVSIGALISNDDNATIPIMTVFPQKQTDDIVKAISLYAHMIKEADKDGHVAVALTAPSGGFKVYQEFGFVPLFEYVVYHIT